MLLRDKCGRCAVRAIAERAHPALRARRLPARRRSVGAQCGGVCRPHATFKPARILPQAACCHIRAGRGGAGAFSQRSSCFYGKQEPAGQEEELVQSFSLREDDEDETLLSVSEPAFMKKKEHHNVNSLHRYLSSMLSLLQDCLLMVLFHTLPLHSRSVFFCD